MDNNQSRLHTFPFVIHGKHTPNIADTIFGYLDQNTLAKSRLVSKVWKDYIDWKTFLWGNVSKDQYIKAAKEGRLDICRLIIRKAENKNPASDRFFRTPLHEAALKGHLEICRLIIENVSNKNPADAHVMTPLHYVAGFGQPGHLDVCRLILENIENKSPVDKFGRTPLHVAAMQGELEMCRILIETMEEKNPPSARGETPLHWAAKRNHPEVCRLIISQVEEIHPVDHDGNTPLDKARGYQYQDVIDVFEGT